MADRQTEEFLREGMARYGKAAYLLVAFGKEVEARLQALLKARQSWGDFTPGKQAKTRSTRYWSEYPLLNAKIEGELRGTKVTVVLAVNWYASETEYPFYAVWIEPQGLLPDDELGKRTWSDGLEYRDGALRLLPKPDDFNLERDCGRLLDAFVGCLPEGTMPGS